MYDADTAIYAHSIASLCLYFKISVLKRSTPLYLRLIRGLIRRGLFDSFNDEISELIIFERSASVANRSPKAKVNDRVSDAKFEELSFRLNSEY